MGANKASESVVYGQHFVLSRPRVGGEGLVAASKNVQVERFGAKEPRSGPPAVKPRQELGLALNGIIVVDTDFEVIQADQEPPPQPSEGSDCVGLVYLGSSEDSGASVQGIPGRGMHPRRTARIRFTCNLCETANEKDVNPHAWRSGSVFARCEGCSVVHKLQDNLKVRLAVVVYTPCCVAALRGCMSLVFYSGNFLLS